MARPRSAPDLYLLSKVSTLYYLREQTQQDIAERLRISRPTVSRLLQEARDQGIVQITVAPPRGLHIELETRLEDRYGLEAVQVAAGEAGPDGALLRRQVGSAAAAYLSRTIQPNETIGLAWGTWLSAMVHAVAPMHTSGVRVVQTLGGVGPPNAEAYASDLVRRLAHLLSAVSVLLPAPGVVATAAVRDALRGDPHVQVALRQLDALDVVFVGIGALETNPLLNDGRSLADGSLPELRAAGAVGDIALRFFDAHGAPVASSLDDRLIGITTEQLRKVRRVVAVAGGRERLAAIRAALNARLVHVLITDEATAQALANGERRA